MAAAAVAVPSLISGERKGQGERRTHATRTERETEEQRNEASKNDKQADWYMEGEGERKRSGIIG